MTKQLRSAADLPIHPRTGLRAIYVRKDGRAFWPILGGDGNAESAVASALAEHDEKLQTARSAILELGDKAELTDEESKRFEQLEKDYTELEASRKTLAERAERMAKVREAYEAGGAENAEADDDEGADDDTSRSGGGRPLYQRARGTRRAKVDPFKDYATTRSMAVGDVVTRARQAVEQAPDHTLTDAQRSRIEADLVGDRRGHLARHIMAGQNPHYLSVFDKIVAGDVYGRSWTDAERAAVEFTYEIKRGIVEGNNAAGGFLVPPYFDPTIVHTQEDSVNPLRQLCDQRTINGPKYTAPTMGGVSAGYVGETVEINESTPVTGQFSITVQKAGAYIKASTEALEDTNIGAEMAGLLQEAKDEFEAREFLLGDGATGHIRGIVTALVAQDGAAASGQKLIATTSLSGDYNEDDIYGLVGATPARYRQQLAFLAELNFYLRTRRLAKNNNLGAFWTDLNDGNPSKIVGKPTYEASLMKTAIVGQSYTAGDVIALAGDFRSYYLIVDRRGMVIEFDAMVKGPNGRPTGEKGWYATWRTGGDARPLRAMRGLKAKA